MTDRRRRILYIHHGKGIGGAPISLLQMVCALDKEKFDPAVLFLHDSDAVGLFRERGVKILGPVGRMDFSHTKIWWYRWFHPHHFFRFLWDSWCLWRGEAEWWMRKANPDIVHLNTSTLLVWGIVAKKLGLPVVWHIREPLAHGYFGFRRKLVRGIVGKYADKILPICRHDALPWHHLEKTQVLYNAVDLNRFDPERFLNCKSSVNNGLAMRSSGYFRVNARDNRVSDINTNNILFLGGLSREKGTYIILKAFTKVLKFMPTARLVIAGYWDNVSTKGWRSILGKSPSERLKDEVELLLKPIKHAVCFTGPITNVPEIMATSSCVVFPATVGHFARPVIEAGCMGIPVVASKLAPMDELVQANKTGFLVDPYDDVDFWAKILIEICLSKILQKRIGENAKKWCRHTFALEAQVNQLQKVYEELLLK